MNAGHIYGEFHPERIPRRGEFIAWCSAILVGIAWLILLMKDQPVHPALPFLEVFLLLSGLSISLGNWMDRRTLIKLDEDGVGFQNGLRDVRLGWDEVVQVRVFPARWGKKVQVMGDKAFFEFRTLGKVKLQGEQKARLGFERGEDILRQIIINSSLQPDEGQGEGYYYVRK